MRHTGDYLRSLEEDILITVSSLSDAYDVAIHKKFARCGRYITVGSLYTPLTRFHDKGYLGSRRRTDKCTRW